MTFYAQLYNIILFRIEQIESRYQTVNEIVNSITALYYSYNSSNIFKVISDAGMFCMLVVWLKFSLM